MPPFEPALEEDLSDANLARLLAADARLASQKYSTQGLSALLGGRSQAAPKVKPNTRFLQNLVKNADTHNDRLKRKEDAERREKLRKLDEQEDERRRDDRANRREARDGHDGPDRKRRRLDGDDDREHSSRHHHRGRDREKRRRRHHRRNTSSASSRSRSPTRPGSEVAQHLDSHRKHRSRREDPTGESYTVHRSHRKHTRRRIGSSPSPGNNGKDGDEKHPESPGERDEDTSQVRRMVPETLKLSSPQHHSRMDAHFSTSYDPVADTHPDSGEDSDWDRALNAMRDRANFQRTQASRLLAAGFSEEQVKKWETQPSKADGEGGRDVRDVKWQAKGEEREWDKGKPLLGEDVTFSDTEEVVENGTSTTKAHIEMRDTRQEGWKKSGGLLKGFKNALGS